MNSNSAKPFRRYLHSKAAFEQVINFGENQPFKGAEMVYPTMAILRRGQPESTFQSLFIEDTYRFADLGTSLEQPLVETVSDVTGLDEWRFQSVELTRLFQKIIAGKQTLGDAVGEQIYRGIVTGYNDAFIIDAATCRRLIDKHPSSAEIIKPMLRGQNLRPWYHVNDKQHLVWAYQGINISSYPVILDYLTQFQAQLAKRWEASRGQCEWYELRPCTYYDEFLESKIFWPDIAKLPRFSMDDSGYYANNKCYLVARGRYSLLAILQSRISWFSISQVATPLRLRAGLWQYQLFSQFIERLSIPELTTTQESQLAEYAEQITGLARERYQLHENMRETISADFGDGMNISTRVALYEWWQLENDSALSQEIKHQFKKEIPLGNRREWRGFLSEQKAEHKRLTDEIIRLETALNVVVYKAFNLTPEEIDLIERATKYPYGAV